MAQDSRGGALSVQMLEYGAGGSRVGCVSESDAIAEAIERYLREGTYEVDHPAWPGNFLDRARRGRDDLLAALAAEVRRRAKVAEEEDAMRDAVMATTNNRRVLGSMNDFANMLDAYLDDRCLTEVALHLADSPCSPIGMNSPREATLTLFSTPSLRLVRG
jgi:hypothetical protein